MSSRWSLSRSICNIEHVILSRISDDTSSHSLRSARGTWRSITSQWWWNLKTWRDCWQWWRCLMTGMIWMILIHSFSLELEFVVRNKDIKWQTLRSGNQLDICLISYVDIYMIIMLSNHAFEYPVCEIYYVKCDIEYIKHNYGLNRFKRMYMHVEVEFRDFNDFWILRTKVESECLRL